MRETTCCFTGHRKIPVDELEGLAERLEKTLRALIAEGVSRFAAGGAVGFDTLAAQTVLRLRAEYSHIRLVLILPCPNQTRSWSARDTEEYERIRRLADETVYVSPDYGRGCMQRRNRRLVEEACVCVYYLTRTTGGTAYTVALAEKAGLRAINIANKTGA